MIYKVAIIGSHSSGKTTKSVELALQYKRADKSCAVLIEVSRLCPFQINTPAFVEWVVITQIKNELEYGRQHQVVVCDRSSIDFIVYADVFGSYVAPRVREFALQHFTSYDKVLLLRPKQLIDDGVRDTSKENQANVYARFLEYLPVLRVYNPNIEVEA